jgi:hypothetical protein
MIKFNYLIINFQINETFFERAYFYSPYQNVLTHNFLSFVNDLELIVKEKNMILIKSLPKQIIILNSIAVYSGFLLIK